MGILLWNEKRDKNIDTFHRDYRMGDDVIHARRRAKIYLSRQIPFFIFSSPTTLHFVATSWENARDNFTVAD